VTVEQFAGDLRQYAGNVFASWFLANPNHDDHHHYRF
jgi:hypothetical protein